MYEYTDVIIRYLEKRYIRAFRKLKYLLTDDELEVLRTVNTMYADLNLQTKDAFRRLADYMYKKYGGADMKGMSDAFLEEIYKAYDPVVMYVYDNEVERKASRLAEAILGSPTPRKEIDRAMRYWSIQVKEFAVRVTDESVKKALTDNGIDYVRWITEIDGRECSVCYKRNKKIYKIDGVPPKPHIGCRCILEGVKRNASDTR